MTGNQTATVETLTAEVRVLMVSSRQVTMSVYGQLDHVEYDEIEPFGRVTPKDAQAGDIYIIGRHAKTGELVSSWLPVIESRIRQWVSGRSSAAAYERSAENEDDRANRCENQAAEREKLAERLLGEESYFVHSGYEIHNSGAGYYDARAAECDEEAAGHEQKVSVAEDEITRLKALAEAASEKHQAARARENAEEARGQAAALQAEARDYRTRATVHKANAEAHRVLLGKWTEWESEEIGIVLAKAAEWETLPLIVLAGLR